MKRTALLMLMMTLMVALSAGVAVALNEVDCPNRPDGKCIGTTGNDLMIGNKNANEMAGRIGNDDIYGRQGPDTLQGGPGADYLDGGLGNDRLAGGQDGDPDEFYCATGTDRATIQLCDQVETNEAGLVEVTLTTVEAALEAITTCEQKI